MYLNINTRVLIDNRIEITTINSIKIESSVEALSDTAKISIPRELSSLKGENILKYMKAGQPIKIEAGYNDEMTTEFEGYITDIGAETPLVIECEDEMYQLKRKPKINEVYESITLKQLLGVITPSYEIEAPDTILGKFEIENATPFKVLKELKRQYGIRCFFKGKKIVAGLLLDFKVHNKHRFVFGQNIRSTSSLKYLTKEKRARYYKAESVQKGTSEKITFEYGDVNGDQRTFHLPVNLTLAQVKEWTIKEHSAYVFDGYSGNLEGWGWPVTKLGDAVEIIDPKYNDGHRDTTLFLGGVTILINENDGFKRINKLLFKTN